MQALKNLSAINTNSHEGRYLMAALTILTTTPDLLILGETVRGTATEPDVMLGLVDKLQEEMYKDVQVIPDPVVEERPLFEEALSTLINKYSVENGSDTPDYLLAQFLCNCLSAYQNCVNSRDKWFNVDMWTSDKIRKEEPISEFADKQLIP